MSTMTPERAGALHAAVSYIAIPIEKELFTEGIVDGEECCDTQRLQWMIDYLRNHLASAFPHAAIDIEADWVPYLSFHGMRWATRPGAPFPQADEADAIAQYIDGVIEDAQRFAERA